MRSAVLKAGVLALLAAWVYAPSLHGTWLWDDGLEVTGNLALRSPGGWWQAWVHPAGMDYFPLKGTFQWVEWRLWGARPLGYHLVNLALHVASALLVWRLLSRLGTGAAYLGGLLFAVHPLAVESVAWISEFKNTVSLPFLLLAALGMVAFDATRRRGAWLGAIAAFVAALACKTSVVMFPFVLLLHAWWRRGRVGRRDLADAAPFFGASLILGLATVWFQATRAIGLAAVPAPVPYRLAQAGWSLLSYLVHAVCPVGLAPLYAPGPLGAVAALPYLAVLLLLGLAWARRDSGGRGVLLGAGWFLLNLVPVLGILPMAYSRISPQADHFAYVSLVGAVGLFAAAYSTFLRRLRGQWGGVRYGGAAGAVAVVLALGLLAQSAHAYAAVFHDEETLWSTAVARNPSAWLAHNNLGRVELGEGRVPEALVEFQTAARLRPDSPEAHANLGTALDALGRVTEARIEYRQAVQVDPGFAGGHFDLGLSLLRSGDPTGAEIEFGRAVALDPGHAAAWNSLGLARARQGDLGGATADYQRALALDPALPEAHLNLGNAFFRAGQMDQAVAEYRAVLAVDPRNSGAHANLAHALAAQGHAAEAAAEFEWARATANH
jgi:protein O-mannosyl-transferase